MRVVEEGGRQSLLHRTPMLVQCIEKSELSSDELFTVEGFQPLCPPFIPLQSPLQRDLLHPNGFLNETLQLIGGEWVGVRVHVLQQPGEGTLTETVVGLGERKKKRTVTKEEKQGNYI